MLVPESLPSTMTLYEPRPDPTSRGPIHSSAGRGFHSTAPGRGAPNTGGPGGALSTVKAKVWLEMEFPWLSLARTAYVCAPWATDMVALHTALHLAAFTTAATLRSIVS
ncbi:MAG: hypothetical protein JO363_10175 [Solirubrobacterales bacterium]|nr:hypothetical protein [Solirubrobacterales bacterium]